MRKIYIIVFFLLVLSRISSAQTLVDSCFMSGTPGTSFASTASLANANSNEADLLQWTGSAWTGGWPGANLTIPPPINTAGCRAIFMGSGSSWTTGGEGFALRFTPALVAGQTYSFRFTYVSHGTGSTGAFAPFIYTNTSGSTTGGFSLGNLPAVGYTWTSNTVTFTATAAQAGHNWFVLFTGSTGSSGMVNSFCCSSAPPCSVNLGPDLTLCPGQTAVLNATTTNASYLWQNSSTGPTFTVTTAGTYWVRVTVGACVTSDTVHVTYTTNPVVNLGNDATLCPSQTLVLNATTPNCTYHWQNNATTPTFTVTTAGTYSVTITNSSGCTGSDAINITYATSPTTTINGPTSICAGTTATLDAGVGFSSYLWSTTATTQSISINNIGTYTVTVSNSNGCTGSASLTVTQSTSSTPTITGPTTICAGTTTTLDAGAGYTNYVWSTSATTQTIPVSASGTYSVSVTNASTCTGSTSITLSIVANPTPTITGTLAICPGASTTLDAGAGYASYLWSTNATTQSIPVTIAGTYSVTVTSATACSGTASVNVTQSANPTPTINGPITICANSSAVLNAGAGYASYLWSTTATTQSITITAGGTYSVTVTNASGCTGSTSLTVTQSTSLTPTITGQTTICPGTSTTLDAGAGYASYLWSTNAATQTIAANAAGTYSVTVSSAGGCTGTASIQVTIIATLPITVTAQPQTVCPGNPVTLTATGGQTYQWNTAPPSTGVSIVVNPTVNTTYIVTATYSGCTGSASVAVTVNSYLGVSTTSTDASCTNDDGTATASLTGTGYTYLWNTVPAQTSQTATGLAGGTYSVTVSYNGCVGTANATIISVPGPLAAFYTKPDIITINEGPVSFYDQSIGNIVSWEWNFGDNNYASGNQVNHVYTDTGSFVITLVVTDANGCMDTAQETVVINPYFAFWIPNSFTPNNDDENPVFRPVGVGLDTKNYLMMIYDRWGKELFNTTNINEGWNGTYNNEGDYSKAVQGVYVYLIQVKDRIGKKHAYKGTVTLIQ